MLSEIKQEYQTTVVAFGKSGLPLGKREDIDDLAIIAQESKDKSLLKLFKTLPDLAILKKSKTDSSLKKILEVNEPETEHTEESSIEDHLEENHAEA